LAIRDRDSRNPSKTGKNDAKNEKWIYLPAISPTFIALNRSRKFRRGGKVEKQEYVVTVINETSGSGRAFTVRAASLETLTRAFRQVVEQLVAPSAADGGPDAKA
jgi:hypothetical protein